MLEAKHEKHRNTLPSLSDLTSFHGEDSGRSSISSGKIIIINISHLVLARKQWTYHNQRMSPAKIGTDDDHNTEWYLCDWKPIPNRARKIRSGEKQKGSHKISHSPWFWKAEAAEVLFAVGKVAWSTWNIYSTTINYKCNKWKQEQCNATIMLRAAHCM